MNTFTTRLLLSGVSLPILLFFLIAPSVGIAQSGAQPDEIWKLLETGLEPQPIFEGFVFTDNLHGFAYNNPTGFQAGQLTASTTDGGRTWRPANGGPVPQYSYGQVQIAAGGMISFDGGKTWEKMNPQDADANLQPTSLYGGTAASARHFASLFLGTQSFANPPGAIGKERIAWTTDGGQNWRTADSVGLVEISPGTFDYVLLPREGFGPFPGAGETRWNFIAGFLDTTDLLVIRSTTEAKDPEYYLGIFNFQGEPTKWRTLPFWKNVSSSSADRGVRIRVVSANLIIAEDVNASSSSLWKSIDTGATWQPVVALQYTGLTNTRFVNDSVWITPYGYTEDGGKTWRERTPFWLPNTADYGTNAAFYPIDADHFLFGEGPMVALSTDAGTTWERNNPFFHVRQMIARDGRIVETRGKHIIRVSTDNGESWSDRGVQTGELPKDLNMATALAWYDEKNDPLRVFGTAIFAPEADSAYVAAIESRDGGMTWTKRGTITGLSPKTIGGETTLQFLPGAENRVAFVNGPRSLFKSTDEGMTWSAIWNWDDFYPSSITMFDATYGLSTSFNGTDYTLGRTSSGGTSWSGVDLQLRIKRVLGPALAVGSTIRLPILADNNLPYLLRSENNGETWEHESLPAAAPFTDGEWIWLDSSHIVVNSTGRLYYSTDGGATFPIIQNFFLIENGAISSYPKMVAHDSRYLYFDMTPLGLGRRQITETSTSGVGAGEDRAESSASLDIRSTQVEASQGTIRFQYAAQNAGPILAELFDVLGRKIADMWIEEERESTGVAELHPGTLSSGNYLLRISQQKGNSVSRMIRVVR